MVGLLRDLIRVTRTKGIEKGAEGPGTGKADLGTTKMLVGGGAGIVAVGIEGVGGGPYVNSWLAKLKELCSTDRPRAQMA